MENKNNTIWEKRKRVDVNNTVNIKMTINKEKVILCKSNPIRERTNKVAHNPINGVKTRKPIIGKNVLIKIPINNLTF